ncbi:head GIN domain-containing protein [Spirosoma montaniterrae]|uniref:Putative auto-transporter adhesin head GIN domain-containing protein n=1 Tax=Spirosoma montaniterrae TaxID=1178516 RepID=A0A1P9X3C8_9BACT|nr:head GIN domain-containing protein [Spirosoma montaniterrae]AQG82119.1 hypothetical protein AWR27_24175 [Spirosoma montaniterrae]
MKRFFTTFFTLGLIASLLTGCIINVNPDDNYNPQDERTATFNLTDFDRLNMGSAFAITVTQGASFAITARGYRNDVDDLNVFVRNGVLNAEYRVNRNRRYKMQFTITMPTLRGVDFSGASQSNVSGFRNLAELSIALSGASKGTFDVQATRTVVNLSGASEGRLNGSGTTLQADLAGASTLRSFDYPTTDAILDVSGASQANIAVSRNLNVTASGASTVRYRGNPTIEQRLSGASTVRPE